MGNSLTQEHVPPLGVTQLQVSRGAIQLTKNFIFLFLARMAQFFTRSIFMIFVARYVGAVEFGRYTFAASFALLVSVVSDMGLSYWIIPRIARQPERVGKEVARVLPIKLGLSGISLLILWTLPSIVDYPLETQSLIHLLGTAITVNSFTLFLFATFRGLERMQYEAGIASAQHLGFCLVAAYLLLNGRGVEALSMARLTVDSVALLALLVLYRKHIGRLHLRWSGVSGVWQIMVQCTPFALQVILASFYFEIGTVVLGTLAGETAVGYYQAAMRIVITVVIGADVISNAYYPHLSKLHAHSREALERRAAQLNRWLIMISTPISVIFFVLSEKIINLLYANKFPASIGVMRFVAWIVVLRFIGYGYGTILTSTDRQVRRISVIGLSAIVSVGTSLLLVQPLRAMGAAIAIVLAHVVLVAGYYWAADLRLRRGDSIFLGKIVLTCMGLGGLLYLQRDWPLIVLGIASCLLYGTIAYLWLLTPTDRGEITSTWLQAKAALFQWI